MVLLAEDRVDFDYNINFDLNTSQNVYQPISIVCETNLYEILLLYRRDSLKVTCHYTRDMI